MNLSAKRRKDDRKIKIDKIKFSGKKFDEDDFNFDFFNENRKQRKGRNDFDNLQNYGIYPDEGSRRRGGRKDRHHDRHNDSGAGMKSHKKVLKQPKGKKASRRKDK